MPQLVDRQPRHRYVGQQHDPAAHLLDSELRIAGLDGLREYGAGALEASGGLALGLLELSLARPAEAIAALEPVRRHARQAGLQDPGWLPWETALIESYCAAGRSHDAREVLDALETRTRHIERVTMRAAAARCAGLLAADDAFAAHFDEALVLLERDGNPFELARTRLCYGERLVRVKQHEPARELLRTALDGFELLRALGWAERTRSALASCGEIARRQSPRAVDLLTPQELQVVRLVAEGARNRDIAARLFLEPEDGRVPPAQHVPKARRALAHRAGHSPRGREQPSRSGAVLILLTFAAAGGYSPRPTPS